MDFRELDAYWRAANYLTVGQIYLQDNPLLREDPRRNADDSETISTPASACTVRVI
jgi:phosphoketolase